MINEENEEKLSVTTKVIRVTTEDYERLLLLQKANNCNTIPKTVTAILDFVTGITEVIDFVTDDKQIVTQPVTPCNTNVTQMDIEIRDKLNKYLESVYIKENLKECLAV